jgi:pimeloyl-ACP methyl ester carboxylesterase
MRRLGSVCRVSLGLCIALVLAAKLNAQAPAPPKKGPFPPTTKAPVPPGGKVPAAPKVPVPPSGAKPNAPKSPAPPQAKGPKVPEPEDITLDTKDGLAIKATYYAGTLKKEAVPFILIHGLDGQRGDMHSLAVYLQTLGHAAIAPDLRGHGQSKSQKLGDGNSKSLDPDKMTKPQLESMVLDIDASKKYLLEKNNSGELNIEQLCVVGAEFGAILAVRFAGLDWAKQDLPAYKLGKDVKALVLLSPVASFKGVAFREAMTVPGVSTNIAMLLVAGAEDSKSSSEVEKLNKQLETLHSKSDSKDVFMIKPDTRLAGAKLLGASFDVKEKIGAFVEKTLVSKKTTFAWQDRKNPL